VLSRVDWSYLAEVLKEKKPLLVQLERFYQETKIFRIVGNYIPVWTQHPEDTSPSTGAAGQSLV